MRIYLRTYMRMRLRISRTSQRPVVACAPAMASSSDSRPDPAAPDVSAQPPAQPRQGLAARWLRRDSTSRRLLIAAGVYLVCAAVFAAFAGPRAAHRAHPVQPLRAPRGRVAARPAGPRPRAAAVRPQQRLRRVRGKDLHQLPAASGRADAPFREARRHAGELPRRPVRHLARRPRARRAAARAREAPAHGPVSEERGGERGPCAALRVRHRVLLHGGRGHGLVRGDGRRIGGVGVLRARRPRRRATLARRGDDGLRLPVAASGALDVAAVRARGAPRLVQGRAARRRLAAVAGAADARAPRPARRSRCATRPSARPSSRPSACWRG